MGAFEDMVSAAEVYLHRQVELAIVEVNVEGDALNVGEIASFRVKVTNHSELNLSAVKLRIEALNGATVANNGAAAPYVAEFVTQELATVAAKGGSQLTVGSPLKLKAPATPQAAKNLVVAKLESWTCDLAQVLKQHGDPSTTPKAFHTAAVRPQ